jgi:hypothetical protein
MGRSSKLSGLEQVARQSLSPCGSAVRFWLLNAVLKVAIDF